jgi:exopolyphosphatase/guanosine-5'-triphosphate,3'-diphosphate pyrophosphatase
MQVAVLDIGTNTVLLLIAELDATTIRVHRDDHAIARLGEGVDRTKHISDEAFQRFLSILRIHLSTCEEHNVQQIVAIGTSALRDAENREDILRQTKEATGVEIEILTGEEEARWTYRGALAGQSVSSRIGVLDIGGGSTEISSGFNGKFEHGVSLDIGAVRITERCFATNPITKEAAATARETIRQTFSRIERPHVEKLIAVAGTPTTLAAMHQELPEFNKSKVQGYILHAKAIDQLLDILLRTDTKTLIDLYPAINKARADILPAGTLILREAMDILGVEAVRVSTHGLRYGIAAREAERQFGPRDFHVTE